MEKIESLFSQWKESSPNQNKVGNNGVKIPMTKDRTLKTEHGEIQKVEESLSESMENHEEEELELMKHDHDSLIEDDEVQSHHEVVCPLPSTDVISIVQPSPTPILVSLMFVKVSHVSVSEDDKHMRVKNKRVKRVMKRERKTSLSYFLLLYVYRLHSHSHETPL